jgi:hypothetical protein
MRGSDGDAESDIGASRMVWTTRRTLLGTRVVSYAYSHRPSKIERALLAVTVIPDGHGHVIVTKTLGNRRRTSDAPRRAGRSSHARSTNRRQSENSAEDRGQNRR